MTKSKSANSSANFLPIVAIVVLILAAGFLLTKDDLDLPWQKSNKIKAQHLVNFPREVPTLQELEKMRVVVKSQKELDDLLKKIDPTGSTRVTENINFDRDYVLVATTETLDRDGTEMKINKIYIEKEGERLKAMILLKNPGDTCETQEVSNIVIDMVKIKKTDLEITFDREQQTVECGDIEPKKDETTNSEETTKDGEKTPPVTND